MTRLPRIFVLIVISLALLGAISWLQTLALSGSASYQPSSLVVVPFVLVLLLAVCYASAKAGWDRFAKRYPVRERPTGKSFLVFSAAIGSLFSGGRNLVKVSAGEDGLFFRSPLPFHPPFLIPWSAIRDVKFSRARHVVLNLVRIDFSDGVDSISLQLKESCAKELEGFLKAGMQPQD